jgi:hypothetical protein
MSMSKGSVIINSQTGEAGGSGFAKVLFDSMDALSDYGDLSGMQLAQVKQQLANVCVSIANVIDYIKENAEVSTTVSDVQEGDDTASGSGIIE